MNDRLFRAKMIRADQAFQRALGVHVKPAEQAPVRPRPAPNTAASGKRRQELMPTPAQRLAMAKRDLARGWDLDSAARHIGADRKKLDLALWLSLGRGPA